MRLAYLVELLPPQQPSVYQHPVGVVVNFYFNLKESENDNQVNQVKSKQ